MIKKAVVAAAGRGTRMLHLTKNKSKHLIKVGKSPFLSYLLHNLIEAGYSELIVVAGYKKDKIASFLKGFHHPVSLVDQFEILGKEKYGTACALECVRQEVGNENFIMVYGDHYFSSHHLQSLNIKDNYSYVSGIHRANPQKYGVLKTDQGWLTEIIEKPKEFIGNFVNIGLYKFTPEIFKKLPEISISERGEYELTDAVNLLAAEKKVKVKKVTGHFIDFTSPADVMRASKILKDEGIKY